MIRTYSLSLAFFLLSTFAAQACATGCTVFDVSTSGVLPGKPGSVVWLEHSYTNQTRNQSGDSLAPDVNNDHKKIRSNSYTAGGQYMFDREWGIRATAPVIDRNNVSIDDISGNEVSSTHAGLGDVRINGIYSGLSPDMSTGLTFGLKLPTGDTDDIGFDRDSAIGTGSTDLLLGFYHIGNFHDMPYGWFVNGQWAQPLVTRGDYRPGSEVNFATGVYHKGWYIGHVKITPVMQFNGTQHFRDSGLESHREDSGYTQLLAAPGIEFNFGSTKLYTDISTPVYQYIYGNQLVAPVTVKTVLSFNF